MHNTNLMKFSYTIFLLLAFTVSFSQTKGRLESTRLVNLDLMTISPKRPPKIEVVFRAQDDDDNEPIWDLKIEDLLVYEDSIKCDVISINQISKNKPINISVIIDHSGSMAIGLPTINDIYNIIFNDASYISPLAHAKNSASTFSSSFNYEKDKISIISFGSKVEVNIPLSKDSLLIKKSIEKIKINGSTAYFDALNIGLDQLKNRKGVNIIVSLTDGAENSSTHTLSDVIAKSRKYNIPIYTIGLGFVQKDTLKIIADTTKGEFYHTNSSSELTQIYSQIGKQIQAYYSIVYKSPSLGKRNINNLTIDFPTKSSFLKNRSNDPDVIAYLQKKRFNQQLKKYGKISVGTIVGVGLISLIYIRKRRKKRLKKMHNTV
jgi:Ca-activated chloride channel family protein